jgi:hypothetical protein
MKKHAFTLVLSGVSELTREIANALYDAAGGDLELSMREGVVLVEVVRSAVSLREAITSLIQAIEASGTGLRVVRVESDDANTIAKINAELLGVG